LNCGNAGEGVFPLIACYFHCVITCGLSPARPLMKSKPTSQTFCSKIFSRVFVGAACARRAGWPAARRSAIARALIKMLPGIFLLASCGWVDSTGVQQGSEAPVVALETGNVVDIIEDESLLLNPLESVDPLGNIEIWRWGDQPIESGNLSACQASNGFNPLLAEESLPSACTRAGDCELYFEQQPANDGSDRAVFLLEPPTLRAPVGVTYQLFGTDESGSESTFAFTFCLISVNEAPDAQNDLFTAIEGQVLSVSAAGPNLLSNDSDDIDVANQPLAVVTQPVSPPSFAAEFELFADGGFRYVPEPGFQGTDSFVYSISDGVHEVTDGGGNQATASITVRPVDLPPQQIQPLPELALTAGIPAGFAFEEFFTDPEGGKLLFTASSLPPGLELSEEGELGGQVLNDAVGDVVLLLSVTDGVSTIDAETLLSISENLPPLISSIPEQSAIVGSTFTLSVASYFSDPENLALEFSMQTPAGLSLGIDRRTGVITGIPATAGEYSVGVVANDGITQVDAEFSLQVAPVPNRRPEYAGAIANQSVEVGEAIVAIVPTFSDPDGDTLVYEITGAVPRGLEFDPTSGTLSGTVTAAGIFRNLVIVATDSGDLSASSDTFNITVTAPVVVEEPETEPETETETETGSETETNPQATPDPIIASNSPPLLAAIPDQGVTVGEDFELSVTASDEDDDELLYALEGAAATFLDIDADSGVISGVFERSGRFLAEVIVSDGPSEASVDFIVVVAEDEETTNRPPVAEDIPNRTLSGDFRFSVRAQFDDPDGDDLSYSATGLPEDVSIAPNGTISGSASDDNEGRHLVIVTADDGRGGTISDGFLLIIEVE